MTEARPRKLRRGDKVLLKFGSMRRAIVTCDERDDFRVLYALENDNPSDPTYGRRVAKRAECSLVREAASFGATIGDFLKGRE